MAEETVIPQTPLGDTPYIDRVYTALKDNLAGFNKTPEQFKAAMQDSAYAAKAYTALKDNLTGFNKTQDDFYAQVGLKKKVSPTAFPSGSNLLQDGGQSVLNSQALTEPTPVVPQYRNEIKERQIRDAQKTSNQLRKLYSELPAEGKRNMEAAIMSQPIQSGLREPSAEEVAHEKFMETTPGKILGIGQYLGSKATKGVAQAAKGLAWVADKAVNPVGPGNQQAIDMAFQKVDENINFGLTRTDLQNIEETPLTRNLGSLAEVAPAGLIPGGAPAQMAVFGLQGIGNGKDQIDEAEKRVGPINPLVKDAFILGNGVAMAALMKIPLFKSIPTGLKGDVAAALTANTIKEAAGKELTGAEFRTLLDKGVEQFAQKLKQGGLNYLRNYNKAVVDLGALKTADFVLKEGVNAAEGKPVFEQNLGDLATGLQDLVTVEAPIFAGAGVIPDATKLFKGGSYKNSVVESLMFDPSEANVARTKDQILEIAQEQGWNNNEINATIDHIDKLGAVAKRLPKNIRPEKMEDAVDIVLGRDELKQQLTEAETARGQMDESVQNIATPEETLLQDKIDQANDKLRDLAQGARTTYSKGVGEEEGKFFKTTDGVKEEIAPSRYELEVLERSAKKGFSGQDSNYTTPKEINEANDVGFNSVDEYRSFLKSKTNESTTTSPEIAGEVQTQPAEPVSPETSSPAVNETVVEEVKIDPVRQKAIDAITHGVVGIERVGETGPRFDLGIAVAEQKRAIRDITNGKYETAAAKNMIDKVAEFEAKGEYPIIEGTGGASVRRRAATAQEIQESIDSAKQYQLAKEQDIEANNKALADLGITYEDILAYENYRKAGEPGTITDNGRATESPASDVQRAKNDKGASKPQSTGGKAVQGEPGSGRAGDPLRSFASKLREGKISKLGGFKASTGFEAVWDASLEVAATAIEGGAKIADAIEAGLKHIKQTDWYKNLSEKEKFDTEYRRHLKSEYSAVEVEAKPEAKASKALKDLSIDIPNGNEVKKYLSGETISKYEGDELRNDQSYVKQELSPALEHGVRIIEQAKEEFGKDYVPKMLDFIEQNGTVEGKALMYVSLENDLAARKLIEPENDLAISKLQDLVRAKSQAYLRSNALAINMGRLRKFAEAGYDINQVTDNFFSAKELEGRKKIEKAIQATPDEINKVAEDVEKAKAPKKAIDFEVKKAPRKKLFKLDEAEKKELASLSKEFRGQFNDVTRIATLLADKKFMRYVKLTLIDTAGDFESFATRMVDELGQKVKEHLPELYKKAGGEDVVEIKGKEKTDAERLQEAKDNINKRIDGLAQEILNKKRELKERKVDIEADAELKALQAEEAALRRVRDKELPLDKKLPTDEQKVKQQANRLIDEIEALDKQIKQGEKDVRADKKDPLNDPRLNKLKAEKEARVKVLDVIDPNPKETVKQALIDSGYGREITVNTKDGKEKINTLDWRKLAGEEGSIANIQDRVESWLKDNGYSDGEIARMQSSFVEEYNNLRASVIEKALNELERRNKEREAIDTKTTAKRLAELYNYGLFEKNADTYDYLMNNALGLNGLGQEAFFQAKVLAKSLSELFKSTDANGKLINQSNLKHAENVINKQIEDLLSKVAWQQSSAAYKAATIVKEYVGLAQRSILVSMGQMLENTMSGYIARAFARVGYSVDATSTKELRAQQSKLAQNMAKDINFNAGLDYGDVNSPFLNKSKTIEWINNVKDNRWYHAMTSAYIGRAFLEAADSMHKLALTEKYFTYNLIKILRKKGMSKEDAVNFVSEQLTGQSFEDAMVTSKTIIDKINTDAGKKIIPDTKESITRFANDIVRESLIAGNKLDLKEVEASFAAAYKSAGFDLGHEANNLVSMGVSNLSAKIQSKAKQAVKEKNWPAATAYTLASTISTNVMNPFVGGGSNWVYLALQKSGVPTLSTMYYAMRARKGIDLTSESGLKTLENDLRRQQVSKNMNIRMVVGAGVSLAAYALAASTGADDDLKKWLKQNEWAKRYFGKVSPPSLSLMLAIKNKEVGHFFAQSLNIKDNPAFDDSKKLVSAVDKLSKGGKKNTELALGTFGNLAGSRFSLPIVPWRITRDAQDIARGLQGLPPIGREYNPKGFGQGLLNGGIIEYWDKYMLGNTVSKNGVEDIASEKLKTANGNEYKLNDEQLEYRQKLNEKYLAENKSRLKPKLEKAAESDKRLVKKIKEETDGMSEDGARIVKKQLIDAWVEKKIIDLANKHSLPLVWRKYKGNLTLVEE